ncbi:MAG: hypothetical protein R2851_00405 [Caldilineaceae bacterium]
MQATLGSFAAGFVVGALEEARLPAGPSGRQLTSAELGRQLQRDPAGAHRACALGRQG